MPTPVKYNNDSIRTAYKHIEHQAAESLLSMLPQDLREEYVSLYEEREEEAYLWRLVKAADKLSALIKCIEEGKVGNREFVQAEAATRAKLEEMQEDLPELGLFMKDFLAPYGRSLDEM